MGKYMVVGGVSVAKEFKEETFGRLTTLGPRFRMPCGKRKASFQVCECECGGIEVYRQSHLGKSTSSCGCFMAEAVKERQTRHGCSGGRERQTAEYKAWCSMLSRCNDPGLPNFSRYGGRGIKVCQRWQVFENFLADMKRRLTPKHSLDRIDNEGDYEPGNCRWATTLEQNNNKRTNRKLTLLGETKTMAQWAREFGIRENTVRMRLNQGWSELKAVTEPVRSCKRAVR